jgi:hypothetical protein
MSVNAKKRYIDPLVAGYGRVSEMDAEIAADINGFLGYDFDYWITATWERT